MITEDNLYKVAIIATMSSGKSTFINALLGKEILSARNTACTANILEIINNQYEKDFKGKIKNNKKARVLIIHL